MERRTVSTPNPLDHLRNSPRQERSARRVETLLDAAESVFEEVGFDAATTNLVAERAEVPVGTLYRWFPDKSALAESLTDRYLIELRQLARRLVTTVRPSDHIGVFLRRFLREFALDLRSQRALPALLVSALVPGRRSPAGERLREGLLAEVRELIDLRIPDIPAELRNDTAEVCVTLLQPVIAAATDEDDARREVMLSEHIDVILAYIEAKFPVSGDPLWDDPDPLITPRWPAPDRTARLAAAGGAAVDDDPGTDVDEAG